MLGNACEGITGGGETTDLLAGVGVVAVAAQGRHRGPGRDHAQHHHQRPDDHQVPKTMHRPTSCSSSTTASTSRLPAYRRA